MSNLTKRQRDDVERLKYARRTHQTHWTMPEMPWKKDKPVDGDDSLCNCGARGKYCLNRWYCQECWDNGDDEDA